MLCFDYIPILPRCQVVSSLKRSRKRIASASQSSLVVCSASWRSSSYLSEPMVSVIQWLNSLGQSVNLRWQLKHKHCALSSIVRVAEYLRPTICEQVSLQPVVCVKGLFGQSHIYPHFSHSPILLIMRLKYLSALPFAPAYRLTPITTPSYTRLYH